MTFDPRRRANALAVMDALARPLAERLNDYAGTSYFWERHVHIRLLAAQIRERSALRTSAHRDAPQSIYRHRVMSPEFTGGPVMIQAVRYDPVGDHSGEFEILPWISREISENTIEAQDQLVRPIDPAHFMTFRPIDTIEGWRMVDWACFSPDVKVDLFIDIIVHPHPHTPDDAEFSLRLSYQQYSPDPCPPTPPWMKR
jgi:hypothetical protein